MSFDTLRRLVETHVNDNWSMTDVAFENIEFTPVIGTPWIDMHIFVGDGFQASLGDTSALNRWTGIIDFSVYVPINTGSSYAYKVAYALVDLFYHYDNNGLTTLTGHSRPIGEDGEWMRYNVSIPFQYDEVK